MTRFDRRALFASGAAAALLAATGVSLLAPRRGGRLRVAVPRTESGLHPIARAALFDTLTGLSPEGLLQSRLARSWRTNEDARIWTFSLREDARFHDGIDLTADDVARALVGRVKGRVTTGNGTLRIALAAPDPQLPIRLSHVDYAVTRPANGAAPVVGTGLYAQDRELPGGGMVATRVPDHPDVATTGWVDSVEIAAFSDPSIRAQALNEGLVDIALEPDTATLDARSGLRLLPSKAAPVIACAGHVGIPDWQDHPDLRLAERVWLT